MGVTAGHRLVRVRARAAGVVLAAGVAASALPALAVPAAATTTPTPTTTAGSPQPSTTSSGAAVSPARPPACANAVQVVVGTVTSPPSPLPRSSSTVGGERLAAQGLQVSAPPGVPAPPVIPAAGWLVADLTTGDVVASCNAHVPFMPASTIKVLTALALEQKVPRDQTYVALPADAAIDGTKVGLSPGSTYTGEDLFHGMLMSSGNDAANALADLAGGATQASALMQAEARRLGAFDTVPVNTSGLDAPGQVTSVYDLALIGRAALERPYLAKVMRTRTYRFPGKGVGDGKARPRYQIQNHNRLLGSYTGATGIKNGYTIAAGGSFVGSATRGGRSYVAAVLRADGRTSDMAAKLLDWAFTNGPAVAPVGRLVTPQEVAGGLVTPAPSASPSTALPSATASPVPTAVVTPGSPPPSALDASGTSGTTSAADAWAAGIVLGALVTFGLGSLVVVLLRARHVRLHGGTIVPGLLAERLGRLPGRSRGAGDDPPEKAFPELADLAPGAGRDTAGSAAAKDAKDAPAKGSPAEDPKDTKDTAAKDMSSKDAPAKDAPAEDGPAKRTTTPPGNGARPARGSWERSVPERAGDRPDRPAPDA